MVRFITLLLLCSSHAFTPPRLATRGVSTPPRSAPSGSGVGSGAAPPVEATLHASGVLELRLCRVEKFNALDTTMLELLHAALDARLGDCSSVLLTAAPGRAFCAGADVKHLSGLPSAAERVEFLHSEYTLHQRLYAAAVPVVALCDGIVMGAGAGLFMAASRRVASARTQFAMPEVKIGLCPDAGALHFLRVVAPPSVGQWLALTGAKLNAADTLGAGLATHFIEGETAVVEDLRAELVAAADGVDDVLERRCWPSGDAAAGQGALDGPARDALDGAFGALGREAAGDDVGALIARLRHARDAAARSVGSCGWRTREVAEASLELLDDALAALTGGGACPAAVGAAFLGFHAAHDAIAGGAAGGVSASSAATAATRVAETARAIELALNARLAARDDFVEGAACAVGARRGETPAWAANADGALRDADDDIRRLVDDGALTLDGVRDYMLGAL